jgi:hypothetical protein
MRMKTGTKEYLVKLWDYNEYLVVVAEYAATKKEYEKLTGKKS